MCLSLSSSYIFACCFIVLRSAAAGLQRVSSHSVLADVVAVSRPNQDKGVGRTLLCRSGQQRHPAPVATSESPGPQRALPGVEGGGITRTVVQVTRVDGGSLQSVILHSLAFVGPLRGSVVIYHINDYPNTFSSSLCLLLFFLLSALSALFFCF